MPAASGCGEPQRDGALLGDPDDPQWCVDAREGAGGDGTPFVEDEPRLHAALPQDVDGVACAAAEDLLVGPVVPDAAPDDRLVVLHERAVADLPPAFRAKAVACFQSTTSRVPAAKPRRHLRAVMVGHLREEKSPGTYFAAARRLAGRPEIRLDHVGAALGDSETQQSVAATDVENPLARLGVEQVERRRAERLALDA